VARVLIVEDLPELADELRTAVPFGHDVVAATSKREALGALAEHAADVVITALVLDTGSYGDGVAVTRAALERHSACRVIVVSSYSTPESCVAAIDAGAFDYIERSSPGIDFARVIRWKIAAALARGSADTVAVTG
jgi:DNA-binding NtrC family response regulator